MTLLLQRNVGKFMHDCRREGLTFPWIPLRGDVGLGAFVVSRICLHLWINYGWY